MSVHNNNGSKMHAALNGSSFHMCILSRVYADREILQIVVGAKSSGSVSIMDYAPELGLRLL
jgi:hypothetical protein